MEESRSRSNLAGIFFLLLVIGLSSASSTSPVTAADGEEKVKLTLYYEALCPYCTNFIVNLLPELFKSGLDEIVELKFSPYGNAHVKSNNTITCQNS